jgi:hypothetical protein
MYHLSRHRNGTHHIKVVNGVKAISRVQAAGPDCRGKGGRDTGISFLKNLGKTADLKSEKP